MIITIDVTPKSSLADEPISIVIKGTSAFSRVTIRATSDDYYCINVSQSISVGSKWQSYAIFDSDSIGCIDLDKANPIGGSYQGIDGMGLVISMKPIEISNEKHNDKLSEIPYYKSYHITLSVEIDDVQVASTEIQRFFQLEDTVCTEIVNDGFLGRFFANEKGEPKPCIIVLSGSDGRIEKAQNIAQLLAAHGYTTLALAYFGVEEGEDNLDLIPLEYIENALNWLKFQPSVISDMIALYGRSKGGELALLAGSIFKDIKCIVANTPCAYVMEGLDYRNRPTGHSSWQFKNKPYPFVKYKTSIMIGYILRKKFLHKSNLAAVYPQLIEGNNADDAIIAVEKINGPLLLLSSKRDEIWPSDLFCSKIMKRLENGDFAYPYKHKSYRKCGHYLTTAYQCNPNEADMSFYQDVVDSWNATLNFLENWADEKSK
ncbi:MAG: acyl-CoA thioesterase/BAAT N-terminal domain-containing protein [Lachnospiraceae bacterium]